jgi:hypothetical protein
MEYRGSPDANVRGRQLRERLENWLRGLDFEEVAKLYEDQDFDSVPTFSFSEGGLSIIFTPMPKGPNNRGRPEVRTIGTTGPMEAGWVHTHDDIKSALEGKAKKYGTPTLPLVVAVNVMSDFCDQIDLANALFGEEQFTCYQSPDGEWHERPSRKPNGVWFGRYGPRNNVVSAALITNQLLPSTLRSHGIDLLHNPWATNPLALDAFPISQRTVSVTDGKINRVGGILASDVLSIPAPWPVPDP